MKMFFTIQNWAILVIFLSIGPINLINSVAQSKQINPTLVISFRGFRADKLDKYLDENLFTYFRLEFIDVGVRANMIPSFPSNCFPNMFSMVLI